MLQPSPTKDASSAYGGMENADFLVEGEITVTITLREYRDLVEHKAKATNQKELDETNARWYETVKERDSLTRTVSDLRTEVERLRTAQTAVSFSE